MIEYSVGNLKDLNFTFEFLGEIRLY